VRATSTSIASPVDQTLAEQAMQGRVQALSADFACREAEVGAFGGSFESATQMSVFKGLGAIF
jgi:hypothetical protein